MTAETVQDLSDVIDILAARVVHTRDSLLALIIDDTTDADALRHLNDIRLMLDEAATDLMRAGIVIMKVKKRKKYWLTAE
jgi:hypothetical protein